MKDSKSFFEEVNKELCNIIRLNDEIELGIPIIQCSICMSGFRECTCRITYCGMHGYTLNHYSCRLEEEIKYCFRFISIIVKYGGKGYFIRYHKSW